MNPAVILALTIFLPMVVFTGSLVWVLVDQNSRIAEGILITNAILELPIIMFGIFHGMWKPLALKYPPQTHAPAAVTRKFQSFSVGIINLTWCVHATVDDAHLHLTPVKWLQFFGARPMSLPWTSLRPLGRDRNTRAALTGGPVIRGPRWCFQMLPAGTEAGREGG